MEITYKTNGVVINESLAEWYFGKKFLASKTEIAKAAYEKSGKCSMKFWQSGTGYLTIEVF